MKNIFLLDNNDEVINQIDLIRELTDNNGWSIIRGLINKTTVNNLVDYIKSKHNLEKEIKVSGNYKRNSPDFQRLDVGEFHASSRLNRYFMFFPWNNDKIFQPVNNTQLLILRYLSRKGLGYGEIDDEESFNKNRFVMSYVIQYPNGGGFMSTHREYNQEDEGDRSYVIYLALTQKNIDYFSGGGFVIKGDEKFIIDDYVQLGDLIVYRGDMYHGVDAIDREKPLNLNQICGRMILTTVFKYFQD